MMQTSHYSSGALVGKLIPNPTLAFAAGIVLHFAIDKIPHFWPKTSRQKLIFTVIDYLVAVVMITLVFLFFKGNITSMLWGFAGSAVVDMLLVGIKPLHESKLGQWHTNRQPHHTESGYLATDILMTLACLTLIYL